jgi:hypothetical protein
MRHFLSTNSLPFCSASAVLEGFLQFEYPFDNYRFQYRLMIFFLQQSSYINQFRIKYFHFTVYCQRTNYFHGNQSYLCNTSLYSSVCRTNDYCHKSQISVCFIKLMLLNSFNSQIGQIANKICVFCVHQTGQLFKQF